MDEPLTKAQECKPKRLTLDQVAALNAAAERPSIGNREWSAIGIGVRTVHSLYRRGLLAQWLSASGLRWELTEVGRAALATKDPQHD